MEASKSADETARQEALRGYGILDTTPEPELDALTSLASHICGTPMAMLTLLDGERQWFKSRVGIDVEETAREASFCTHAIEQPGLFVVHDALEDPRFARSPLVLDVPGIRFYAGAPLRTPEGHALGTLCVVDRVPRTLTPEQMEALRTLAGQAMAQLELKRQVGRLREALRRQEGTEAERAALAERTARHNAALVELARAATGDLDAELRAATRVAAGTLGVERVGIWLWAPGDAHDLACAALYRATDDAHESGARLRAREFPAYFAALAECRTLAAHDARTDPRTREFAAGYLEPQGIGAMLDVPVWRGGALAGVLCCEHVGGPRAWTPDEEEFAANVADVVTLALEAADRRRAEEAARHAEGRGAAVVRAALDCVVMMDGEGRVVDFNPAAERTFGYSAAEAVGRTLAELFIPERLRAAHEAGFREHLAGGTARILGERVETYAVRADGGEFPVELTITRVPLDGPPLFTGHLRDITERADAAAALRESLSLLRATLESAADGLLVVDRNGRVVASNGKFAQMWGIDPADLVAGSEAPLEHCAAQVDNSDEFRAHVLELRGSPEGASFDEVRLRDGRILELYSQPHMVEGESVGRVWSYRDVTERRRAEQEVRRTAERMRAVAGAAAAVVGAATPAELRGVLEEACRTVLTFDAFFIFGYDPRAHTFQGFGGNDAGVYTPPAVSSARGTPGERVVRERRSLLTHSAADPAGQGAEATGTGRRSESVLRTPILVGGEVRGIISVQSYTPERFGAADVEVVEVLASLAATALENIRLTGERAEAEAALRGAVEELRAARDELEERVEERTAELAEANMALEEEVAERARAEEEVRQKSAELQAVFHALPDLYFRMEADGTILDFQAGNQMGVYAAPEEFLGRRVQEVLPPHVGERIGEAMRRVAADGRLTTLEYELAGMECEARLLPLDSSGQVVAIVRDITERKGWERELRRREEHFRALIENASDLISVLDERGAYLYQSPSVHRILGYAADDMLGRHPFHFMHPDDVPAARAALARMLAEPDSSQTVQFRFRHADGSWRVLESTGRTLVPGSPAEGVVVNSRDVTERNRAEEALRRSEEHFRAVIENASDLVTILAPDGTMRYQSPAVERLFGFHPSELEGRSAFELIHPDDAAGVVESLTAVAQNPGETRSAAFRFLHKDGSWRHVESVGTTLSRTGVEEGVIVNSRDVTERKKAEEALEQARAEAERAREAAEAANAAKSEFLSRMSHELRTPMNSILGFAQLLERRSPTPEQRKGVDQILRAGRHLLNLINEVLDIARIESDRQTLSLEPVRLDTALTEAVNLIRPLAAQNDCRVADPQPAPGRWVRADRQRLAQILLNLLSNGVKYNRPGGSVRVTWEDGDGCLRIGIHDTGRGIAPERMEELFVPFARLGAEETGVEGTGLGLALSHRLAEAMDGTLTAESEPGRGSTFWLELPVADDPSSRLPRAEQAQVERPAEERTGPPATLLYVEDNLANLTLVESLLSTRPEITLLSAMQGRMGLDLAWEHAPDLILLDLHLPDMPGSEVLRRLRADARTRETPVVIISADATPGQVERLRGAGAHDYMTKPLDLDRFMDTVDRTLALRRGDAP